MHHFTKHLSHYISLIGVLAVGAYGFVYFSFDKALQVAITIGIAGAYVTWGMVHHYLHRDLHLKVIIEYIVVAVLGLTIVLSLLARA